MALSADEEAAPPLLQFPLAPPGWDGLITGQPNVTAIGLAARPEAWAGPALCVTGPTLCGLSYLARAWAARFGAVCLPASGLAALARHELDMLAGGLLAIDDCDLAAGSEADQLLSLLNIAGMRGGRLLLLSHRPPASWETESADLRSRLKAMAVAEITAPDESHLRARLSAAAAGRFMKLSPDTVNYIAMRIDLCYEAIETFADRLSAAVSRTGRAPGPGLARQVLEGLDDEDAAGGGEA